MLDKRYLAFTKLVQTQSYTKTAELMFVTQSAVSQQIKTLENDLGIKLVEYHQPNLTITQQGLALADFINRQSVQEQQLLTDLRSTEAPTEIIFGATHSLAISLAPRLIAQLQENFSKVECRVDNTTAILNKIDQGDLQFALLEGNFDRQKYDSIVIKKEAFIAVSSSKNPLVDRNSLNVQDLLHETLILRENGSGTRDIFSDWAQSQNISLSDFEKSIEINEPTSILNLVEQNVGISFMYESLSAMELKSGSLKQLQLPSLNLVRDISLVYLKDSYFANQYQDLAQEL
ncbi:LysR family transcriptional regulator [Pediococcus argentinicus]|uniref:Transcriptional regulator n=1 Tax=Pediococcus argentinicus TaxID=480391 RepID=A0A0R2NFL9_9LACO|nr:LysR family transcriptional regulator [Pediococcus argentinicus]KRO24612.1 transcriptional regulator [Pediococcus argentinicus]NKZ22812.1 LysR family transcriptional regulator [Pediococcus argentinicus]GEP19848.1 LysR family transcriptional regulator [Pediococcus argentinicus]